jgi:hypothetical protein
MKDFKHSKRLDLIKSSLASKAGADDGDGTLDFSVELMMILVQND